MIFESIFEKYDFLLFFGSFIAVAVLSFFTSPEYVVFTSAKPFAFDSVFANARL